MTKAESINMTRALAVFDDGKPHTAKDVALACQVHTRTAAWFLGRMRDRGALVQLPPVVSVKNPDFGQFVGAQNDPRL